MGSRAAAGKRTAAPAREMDWCQARQGVAIARVLRFRARPDLVRAREREHICWLLDAADLTLNASSGGLERTSHSTNHESMHESGHTVASTLWAHTLLDCSLQIASCP